jgi:hypothetical protein
MPLCTRPGQTFNYAFPCDRELALATRPLVICKALSQREGEALWEAMFACKTTDEADAKMSEHIVGVTNMGEIKDAATMLAKVTQSEREDLLVSLCRGLVTGEQRKNF